ncbi:MAG: 1-acyl-sn-glycerol-3-phosphate acyltransferase [Actinobacteria bacterium]|nr:1-acyl-sn-glycerol-3-phosphate acyltransferase [Actinomycetota bacterium]
MSGPHVRRDDLDAWYADLLERGRAVHPGLDIGRPVRSKGWKPIQVLFRLVRLRVAIDLQGHEHIKPGAAIFASNHQGALDPIVQTCKVGWRVFAFTKAEWYEGKAALIFRWWGQVPLRRGDNASTEWALEMASFALASGDMMGLYPEATRGPDPTKLYKLHQRVLVPVIQANPDVPVHASAVTYPPGGRLRKRARVRYSEPLPIDARTMSADEITAIVRDAILELGGLEYVDVPAFVAKARAQRQARGDGAAS